ncbi:hypothetical protein HON52_01950 [Candidatus Uhrbacteria bacterium]|jgi:hypothetical protein|nr:hypothetical protein [Candidatus Uhrbacteria bacterium]
MKILWPIFFVLLLLAAFGGPLITTTSGSDLIYNIGSATTLISAFFMLIIGIVASVKTKVPVWLRAILIILVVAVSIGSIVVASFQF